MTIENKPDMFDSETNVIIPQRYIPFDLGCRINDEHKKKIKAYISAAGYKCHDIPGLLISISADAIFKIGITDKLRLYIFSYGIGVFMLEDELYRLNDKFAVGYCEYRKQAHKEILEFNHGEISNLIRKTIADLRAIVFSPNGFIRPSANESWESNGLSYVMTVSYILNNNKQRNDYEKLSDIEKKNLLIMLQPSIAHKEDTMTMAGFEDSSQDFDPYNFEIRKIDEPKNWLHSEDCAIYISWAAVVVYVRSLLGRYMEIIEYLEVDLQAMWLFTYCQYINLKNRSENQKLNLAQLKKEKFVFQRKYNEFISDNDSSVPIYIYEIRGELINTSALDHEKENYMEYIEYCIDETESHEIERQRKFSVMNEVLLFIIAFLQIAPMLYSAMIGGMADLELWPIISMVAFVIVAIIFIIKKDNN